MTGLEAKLVDMPIARLVVVLGITLVLLNLGGWLFLATGRFGELLNIDSDIRFRWPIWDSRINIPSTVNAIILTSAGLLLRRYDSLTGAFGWRRPATIVGYSLVYMALDEFFMLHERMSEATGIHWQLLYAPLVALMGIAALFLMRTWWQRGHHRPLALFAAGGAAWFFAQVLEKIQFDDAHRPIDGYWGYVFVEEVLEFVGSGLFLVAAIYVVRAVLHRLK